jgi:hypothetical protein
VLEETTPVRAAPSKPSTRTEFEKRKKGRLARGPSGLVYRLRQMDLTRHALAGGLPSQLMEAALSDDAGQGLKAMFQDIAKVDGDDGRRKETIQYLDRVVLRSVIEPKLEPGDLPDPTDVDTSEALIPADDYQWIVAVSFRATDVDGDGRHIWGVEDLSRFSYFRHFHGCDSNCSGCEAIRLALSPALE